MEMKSGDLQREGVRALEFSVMVLALQMPAVEKKGPYELAALPRNH